MNKTHILIVEDEGLVAKDLQGMLRRLGYHVPATAGTGEVAIQTALQNKPDLILMDIQLRGSMDGVQAAAAIMSQMDVPIVYLTANSDESTLQRAKATGPFGFLIKPFEERAIQAGIEMAIYKHQTDRRIREREQWLGTTLTSIADAVVTTDATGVITFLNASAEKLSGWALEEARGLPYASVFQVLDETTRAVPPDRIAQALREGESGSFANHTLLARRDATEVHIAHSVAPIRQGLDGRIDGCVIVFSDVSERKQLEEQLRHAQKMDAIGKLAGGIAHDFNNAITVIIGYAEMILNAAGTTQLLQSDAQQIVRAAEHSARLTHQLLAFSRKQVLKPACLDLAEELASIESMVRRLVGATITLTCHVADGLWMTMADSGHMQQVVMNMAINARDAMPHGGRLTFELSNTTLTAAEALHIPDGRPGEFVLLKISDTGTGMDRDTVRRIFEPFFTTKGPGKGTGLGLATCYGIVKQTSGMIAVSSELGVGTVFSIYLPKAEKAPGNAYVEEGNGTLPRGSETILVVEDEEMLRELSVQVLESLGYRVVSAENGIEAMMLLQNDAAGEIHLVVTDLMMPRMSGRELFTWMQENFSGVRVLFTSGYTDDEIIGTALHGTDVEYLQKPFATSELAHRVRAVLDSPASTSAAAAAADSPLRAVLA